MDEWYRVPLKPGWYNPNQIEPRRFNCGYCAHRVSSVTGWYAQVDSARIYICPDCGGPTYCRLDRVMPDAAPGSPIEHLPADVQALREDARRAFAGGAYTATVMVCRKILMHVAVEKQAAPGEKFAFYVEHLKAQNYLPPGADVWVDRIRTVANEANHEIKVMRREDAVALLDLADMMLRHIYEFPNKAPPAP